MPTAGIRSVCVVGAGAMGGQIAHVAALAGYDVRLVSRSQERLDSALQSNGALLRKRVDKGKLEAAALDTALGRLQPTTDLAIAIEGADLILESVVEDREHKRDLLREIGSLAAPEAIIGTNSSTLGSSLFTDCVPHPGRMLNVHFFNPPMLMPLVEVVRGEHTAPSTAERVMAWATDLGKQPILVERESYGFIANRILFIAMQEAFRLVEAGTVSMEDCDLAVRNGLGWPLGPFELADLVGLDVVQAILAEGHAQTGEDRWAPPPLLTERVKRGDLGRKSGRGFRVTN